MKLPSIIKPIKNVFTRPSSLAPATFVSVGVAKTCQDYYEAEDKDKTKILLKDIAILSGSIASLALVAPLTRWFSETKFVDLLVDSVKLLIFRYKNGVKQSGPLAIQVRKVASGAEHVVKEAMSATVNTFAGIMGAVHANEFMQRYVFSKPPFNNEDDKNNQVLAVEKNDESKVGQILVNEDEKAKAVFKEFAYVDKNMAVNTANRVFSSITDLPGMKVFEKPFVALSGFSVANTEGYSNKFKKTISDLLANTLIPTFFVSATSLFVENKKALVKYPALFASLLTGALLGGYVADKTQDKIDKGIDNINLKLF